MIVSILLAAGASRRFGTNKLLAPLPEGTPIVVASARAVAAAGTPVLAVVRPSDVAVAAFLREVPGVRVSLCPDADAGMARSLAHGVAESPDAMGWLIALADMPWLRPVDAAAVARALSSGAAIAAPVHEGRRGHPVGFSARWRAELLALAGDRGAQDLVRSHEDLLTLVPTGDPGVVRDVDQPADLRA
jgi:molybdenum cofactor cytidylyltransferase